MALEWNNFRLPKEKHLFVPTMLYFLIFLKNVGERKEKKMEENFINKQTHTLNTSNNLFEIQFSK